MRAIQLHDYDEEIIGTVLLKNDDISFEDISNAWDRYLIMANEDNKNPNIHDFIWHNLDICDAIYIDFYQPSNKLKPCH